METIDIDHLSTWIGREAVSDDVLTVDLARRFHATIDLPGTPPEAGDIAPRMIHFCLAQPVVPTALLGIDGHPPTGDFLPPVPLPRRMWAAGKLQFHAELEVGDRIRRTSRIVSVQVKQGRTGTLCFVTVSHRIEARGLVAIEETQDLVYRGAETGGRPTSASVAEPAPPGERVQRIVCGPARLFRYSAITFNSHRIHYDRPYAIEEEGYAGLVVHGPLQATLLMHLAIAHRGAPPSRFAFRSAAPLFDHQAITLNASAETGARARLWTAAEGGPIATSAEAEWDI